MKGIGAALRGRFLRFRREFVTVAYAIRHPATPVHLKLLGVLLLAYLASPIDLVPVVIPFLGVVDDLILVPWGLSRLVRRLPEQARQDSEARAARFIDRWVRRPLLFLAILVAGLALLWALVLWYLLR